MSGGLIHWLPQQKTTILTYDVRTRTLGTVTRPSVPGKHHLAVSSVGKLRIIAVDEFVISMWQQQHSSNDWALEAVIDTKENMRSLPSHSLRPERLYVWCSGESGSNTVLLQLDRVILVLDLETKKMRQLDCYYFCSPDFISGFLFEVDMSARLKALKDFS